MEKMEEKEAFTYPQYFKDMVKEYYPEDTSLHELVEANVKELPMYFLFPSQKRTRMFSWLSEEWGRIIEMYIDGETEYGW